MDFTTKLAQLYAQGRPQYPKDTHPQQYVNSDRYSTLKGPEPAQDSDSISFNPMKYLKKDTSLADPTVDIAPGEGGNSAAGEGSNALGYALAIIYGADQAKKEWGGQDIPFEEKTKWQKATDTPGMIMGAGGAPWWLFADDDSNFFGKLGKEWAKGEAEVFKPISEIISWLGLDL